MITKISYLDKYFGYVGHEHCIYRVITLTKHNIKFEI